MIKNSTHFLRTKLFTFMEVTKLVQNSQQQEITDRVIYQIMLNSLKLHLLNTKQVCPSDKKLMKKLLTTKRVLTTEYALNCSVLKHR